MALLISLICLLDFPVDGHLTQDRIVLLEFETIRSVLPVLLRYVAAGAWLTTGLVLGALQNDQVTIAFAFLSHGQGCLELYASFDALGFQLLNVSVDTKLIDGPHSGGRDTKGNELTRFRNEELLLLNVRYKTTLRLPVGVGNIVAADWLLTR